MTNRVIATAKVTYNSYKQEVVSVSDFSYPNADYKNTSLETALKKDINYSINSDKIKFLIQNGIIPSNEFYIQVFDNERIELLTPLSPSQNEDITKDLSNSIKSAIKTTAEKISKLNQQIPAKNSEKNYKVEKIDPNTSPITFAKKSQNILKSAFKGFLKSLDYIFVKKLYHAKLTDFAIISLFSFTILATSLAIFAPHIALLHFAMLGSQISHPVFGALNITVGLSIFTQATKNLIKAKKNQNKEEMILAIVSMLFALAIMSTGITAACNFSNDFLLKTLFTTCASFTFGVGIYNTIKTQLFRKKLKNAENLKEFLKKQLEISDKEYKNILEKIKALKDKKEIEKLLKKYLSKKEFDEIKKNDETFLKDQLVKFEKQTLERKKRANVEKILRNDLTKRAIAYINGKEDLSLEEDIKKELIKRNVADTLRIVATSLAIGAFGFNLLSSIENINIQNLIYYSTMLGSKLSGFWQNYFPSWRNVPADENKKSKKSNNTIETKDSLLASVGLQEA